MLVDADTLVGRRFSSFFDARFRHLVSNSTWAIATTVVVAGALFAETILLARYLGASGFGIYVLAIGYPEAVQLLLGFRTREAMTRYLGDFLAHSRLKEAAAVVKLLWATDLCVLLLTCVIVVATAPFVAPLLTDDQSAVSLMQIYAIALVFSGLYTTSGSVLRVFDRFGLQFCTGAGMIVLRVATTAALISMGVTIEGLIWGRVFAELVAALVVGGTAFLLLKHALWLHRRASLRALSGRLREIARFLLHMNVQGSIRAVSSKIDVLMIGALAGPSSASIYKVGVQFGSSPLLLSDPLFVAVYPQFTRWRALGQVREIRSVGRKASLVLAALAIPVALVLAAKSEPIISLAVGSEFADAWLPMTLILVGVLPAVFLFWGRAAMLAFGDAATATRITVGAIAAQFAVLFSLVPIYGATGAALGVVAMNLMTTVFTTRYLRRRRLI